MAARFQHNSALEEIEKYEKAVCKSVAQINKLADLTDFAKANHPKIASRGIQALARVYKHLDQRFGVTPIATGKPNVDKYNEFVHAQFMGFVRFCLSVLRKKSDDSSTAALHALLQIVRHSSEARTRDARDYYFEVNLFERVMYAMLDAAADKEEVLSEFVGTYLNYDDVRLFTLMSMDKYMQETADAAGVTGAAPPKTKKAKKESERRENYINNIYMILHQLEMPHGPGSLGSMFASVTPGDLGMGNDDAGDDDDEAMALEALMADPTAKGVGGGEKGRKGKSKKGRKGKRKGRKEYVLPEDEETLEEKRMPLPLRYAMHRKHFSSCWDTFLSLRLPKDVLKNVLETIDFRVMPHYSQPKKLLDFLAGAFNTRGIFAILALNALFVLMHTYQLEYPRFYEQLYSLLEPGIFHVKYRVKFFRLLNLFLSSTHLPAYVAAAFAKRLGRLALSSPVHGCVICCQLIYNLLKRHPICKALIHKGSNDIGEVPKSDGDPYMYDEPDLAKCRAMESSLWEVEPLLQHYNPEVIKAAKALKIPALRKGERRLEKTTLASYSSIFNADAEWAVPEDVATTFVPPTMGFMQHSGECFTSLWDSVDTAAEEDEEKGEQEQPRGGKAGRKGGGGEDDDNTLLEEAQKQVDALRQRQEEREAAVEEGSEDEFAFEPDFGDVDVDADEEDDDDEEDDEE